MPLQIKETGTTVDFTNAREINTQKYLFQGDVFGVYAYQGFPVTVSASVRDAFANGSLSDLLNQASGQGMPIEYIRISWNETQQGSNYYITDLVVGAVSKSTGYINIGSAYLINALKAVSWFNQLISKLYMPWKAWELLQETQTQVPFRRWTWDAKSSGWGLSAPIGSPIPNPPSMDELVSKFKEKGNIDAALGEFARKMLDGGYTVTLLSYKVQVCLQRSPEIRQPGGYFHGYIYTTHTRLTVEYKTDPEIMTAAETRSLIGWIVFCIGVAVIVMISALAAGVIVWFNNISTETTVDEQIVEYIDPVTGQVVRRVIDRKTTTAPPEWWGTVIAAVSILGIIIVAAVVLPRILPSGRREYRPTEARRIVGYEPTGEPIYGRMPKRV